MASAPAGIDQWIRQHLRADAPRPRSLIVTMFGDAVAPYSDGIWLSDLIELLEPLGANERLVRTSVFRLVKDGWLTARREGRRSWYTLAPGGRRRFQHAYDRVYTPAGEWDGRWAVVILPQSERGGRRINARGELEWEGYGALAPGVFLRPGADLGALREILKDLGVDEHAVVLQAELGEDGARAPVAGLVARCWKLQRVAAGYRRFLARFQPVHSLMGALIAGGSAPTPERAFAVQTLLIDSYRRLTLHDPHLPAALLPADWPGHAAYQLCRRLYQRTYRQSREFLLPRFAASARKAPAASEVARRFGGL